MVASFWLLSWAFIPAQVTNRPMPTSPTPAAVRGSDAVLAPRLVRGQELVYRGAFTEEATGGRVQFGRSYRFETRFFVLDTPAKGVELAGLTLVESKGPSVPASSNVKPEPQGATSVRLERLNLNLQGKVSLASGGSLLVPLERFPTIEVGAFLELPSQRKAATTGWEVAEQDRPALQWRVNGSEVVNGQTCTKVVGVQQSDDWEKPRADRSAWRRLETVWVGSRSGLVQKLERVIEHREPARREIAQRRTLRYDLESSLQYPPQLGQDRRQEITQAFAFREAAQPLIAEPARYGKQLQMLQRKIAYHVENQPTTPYREAVQHVRRQVEAAIKGEAVRETQDDVPARAVPVAVSGELAPDFVAGPITTKESGKLSAWKGKPVLLVFYQPGSATAQELLRFAQQLHQMHGRQMSVVGMSVSDDATEVLRQREGLKFDFPVYRGAGMRISYGVDSTPKLVVIDGKGYIRGAYHGWGQQTAHEVTAEVRRWLPGN